MRILAVDDSDYDQHLLGEYVLGPLADQVVVTKSAAEALAALELEPVDLVVTDLHLHDGVDGLELVRQIKADSRWASIPVIVFTMSEPRRDPPEASIAAGAARHIIKPAAWSPFRDAITTAVNAVLKERS